jgi:hypothetical protein
METTNPTHNEYESRIFQNALNNALQYYLNNRVSDISSNQMQINSFNDEYHKYEILNYEKNPNNLEFQTEISPTINNEIIETTNILNREYTLLFIWFIIAIIFFVLLIVGILSTELNNYVLYPSLAFLIFIIFYIIKNIYIYFNESI